MADIAPTFAACEFCTFVLPVYMLSHSFR